MADTIEGKISLDVKEAVSGIKAIETSVGQLGSSIGKMTAQLDAVLKKFEEVSKEASTTINNVTKITTSKANDTYAIGNTVMSVKHGSNSKTAKKAQDEVNKALEKQNRLLEEQIKLTEKLGKAKEKNSEAKLLNAQKAVDKTSDDYIRAMNARTEAMEGSKNWRAYREKHPELFVGGGWSRGWRNQMSNAMPYMGSQADRLGLPGQLLGGALKIAGGALKSPWTALRTALSVATKAVTDFGQATIKAYSEIESIKTQLGVVFSSQTQADATFGKIAQYATHSPFGVQQTSELAILLKQSGVYASDLMDTMKMLGDTAGGNMEKMKRIANNYAQIVSIGKASMLDMRQFAYAGIPIFQAVSEELGVSQQHLRKMISEGKVTSDIIEKVFKNLTGINGIFENATEKGAKTLKARIQNLSDAKQLMYASFGEHFTKVGEKTGGDSFAISIVSGLENIYSYLQDYVSTKNIQHDIETIAKRNDRIKSLTEAKQYFEGKGDKETAEIFRKALENELNKIDVEKERNAYALSYDVKEGKVKEYEQRFGTKSIELLEEEINTVRNKIYSLSIQMRHASNERYDRLKVESDYYEALRKDLEDYQKALKQVTLEEEKRANVERRVEELQSKYFDTASKASDQNTSFSKLFSNLQEMYESSDEYKEEQEKKKIELLEEAKEVLKELLKYKDEEGNIDITKLDYKTFSDYLGKRILDEGRKLLTAPSNSESAMTADRKVLEAQYETTLKKIYPELYKQQKYDEVALLQQALKDNPLTGTNKEYFTNFAEVFDTQTRILQTLVDNSYGEEQKKYKTMLDSLIGSTFQYGAPSANGLNANLTDTGKGTSYSFVPLWKRILAQYTGLTTEGMTTVEDTLKNYKDNMAIKNMAASVLSATLKSAGVERAMSLVKVSKDTGTFEGKYQVDWLKTNEAIKEFATSLSASTEVVDAYKKGLEEQLDVYQQLVVAGYTQAESQDLKGQKFVSTKQLKKLAIAPGSQLVNAFGENLMTADGLKVTFNGEDFVDEKGRHIQEEQLLITDDLFEFIKKEIPSLRKEITHAQEAQTRNSWLEKALTETFPTTLVSDMIKQLGANKYTSYIVEDYENSKDDLDTYIKELKANDDLGNYSLLKDLDINEIIRLANQDERFLFLQDLLTKNEAITGGNELFKEEYEEYEVIRQAGELFNAAVEKLKTFVKDFVDTPEYKDSFEKRNRNEKQTELNRAVLSLSKPKDTNLPVNYGGVRGLRNYFIKNVMGVDQKYDAKDLYASMAIAANESVNKKGEAVNAFGIKSRSDMAGKSSEEIWKDLSFKEKEILKFKQGIKETTEIFDELVGSVGKLGLELGKKTFVSAFESWGDYTADVLKNVQDASASAEKLGASVQDLAQETLLALGPIMQQAGFELVSAGAISQNWGMVAGGLAIAAAGGFASGLLNNLFGKTQDDDNDNETEKLQDLKDDLVKILQQARSDALYYENNLRHKTALGINEQFSHTAVHDAIISPNGDVITTDPRDYLIATKTPEQLTGGVVVRPVINNKVINNTSANVRQEETTNPDGSIDIITIIEDTVGNYIASSRSDSAFEVRASRQRGRQYVM